MLVMRASRSCDVLQWKRSAIGLVLGIAGKRFVSNYNPSDNIGASAPAVFGRRVEQNELVFVSQDYSAADSRVMPRRSSACSTFRLLTTASDIATRGRSRMALTSRLPRLTPRGNSLSIMLGAVYIISNKSDMEASGVLEESNSVLNPIWAGGVDEFQRLYAEWGQANVIESGILEDE